MAIINTYFMEQVEKSDATTHNKDNCWFDGEKYIPFDKMTETHLKRAKKYAQRMEEYHWHKSSEFNEKVEKLEEEAKKRGIKLADYRSKFHKNNKRFKKYIDNMPETK
jgi:hypothetical protein